LDIIFWAQSPEKASSFQESKNNTGTIFHIISQGTVARLTLSKEREKVKH